MNCGNRIEGVPFNTNFCSEICKVEYKTSIFQFPDFQKGHYSIVICRKLNIPITNPELLFDKLDVEGKKFFFLIETKSGRYTRFLAIRKTWTLIDKYDKEEGLIKKKELKYTSILFDYFEAEGFIIFHSEMHKVRSVIKYLNYTHNSKILIPKSLDLNAFLNKLDASKIASVLEEGRVVNYKLKFGTIGNFHFKKIVKEDLNGIINQKNAFFSSLKFHVEGVEKNYKIELFLNGSFYISKGDDSLLDILTIYLSLMENQEAVKAD